MGSSYHILINYERMYFLFIGFGNGQILHIAYSITPLKEMYLQVPYTIKLIIFQISRGNGLIHTKNAVVYQIPDNSFWTFLENDWLSTLTA